MFEAGTCKMDPIIPQTKSNIKLHNCGCIPIQNNHKRKDLECCQLKLSKDNRLWSLQQLVSCMFIPSITISRFNTRAGSNDFEWFKSDARNLTYTRILDVRFRNINPLTSDLLLTPVS